ncbi:tyrosine-type recombinase/integrase [Starkeya sp. ORNL1]|uniref:tyrosine-type recombinase/integrase n=1 Tax=Starkeya sp. ORNL1 TaxID=2709380 RepID=UPI001FED3901|nr:tyrosine-type recombinase/integrase [Starkeya sp. ORNL1]
MRAIYDTPEFWAEYNAALTGTAPAKKGGKVGSLRWGIDRYRASSAWAALAPATRRQRENVFHQVVKSAGDELVSSITQKTIIAGRERRSSKPHAANNFLKAMRGFFEWASGDGQLVKVNPCLGVKTLKGENDDIGFHTWTEEEVSRFESHWRTGTRQRLAFDILLYTGLRRGDAVRLGRQHVRDGLLTLRTEKTGEQVILPVLPVLAASIAATKVGELTFLITERGQPFVKESFGNWFREACTVAGCPGSAHGLRKAGATRAAENGASDRQLMALFGWSTGKMATHYTRAADRKRLAEEAAKLLMPKQSKNKNARTMRSGTGGGPKTSKKSGG